MTRPLRIQFENAFYHVTCRGNARTAIFLIDSDRKRFLELLERSIELHQVDILAFVLMENHFHLVVKTPLANLQEFMRHFNISYTAYFNKRHDRVGHLYQGRYKSFLIDADNYLLEVSRYVHLNPVRIDEYSDLSVADKKKLLMSYVWSSYGDYIFRGSRFPFLCIDDVLSWFDGSKKRYAGFVESAVDDKTNPLEMGKGHGIVGEDSFIENLRMEMAGESRREQPAVKKMIKRIEAQKICSLVAEVYNFSPEKLLKKGRVTVARDVAIDMLYRFGGMNQREIGELMGIDYSSVSVAMKRLQQKAETDRELRRKIEDIRSQVIKE